MKLRLFVAVMTAVAMLAGCSGSDRVLVGAGTTTVDSGIMGNIESRFTGDFSVVGGSTAELLESAAQGALDVVIVHDERQERAFVAEHPDAVASAVFASRFLLVGPEALVTQIDAQSPAAAFAEIANRGWAFVTRADGSGTHAREMAIWAQSGVEPAGNWYIATGQGMGFTLQVADQRSAFTLVEEGAFRAAQSTLTLAAIDLPDDSDLVNPYTAILVADAGRPFFEWLIGAEGRAAILAANDEVFATVIYQPSQDGE